MLTYEPLWTKKFVLWKIYWIYHFGNIANFVTVIDLTDTDTSYHFFGFIYTSEIFFIFSSSPVLAYSTDVVFVLSTEQNIHKIHPILKTSQVSRLKIKIYHNLRNDVRKYQCWKRLYFPVILLKWNVDQ